MSLALGLALWLRRRRRPQVFSRPVRVVTGVVFINEGAGSIALPLDGHCLTDREFLDRVRRKGEPTFCTSVVNKMGPILRQLQSNPLNSSFQIFAGYIESLGPKYMPYL